MTLHHVDMGWCLIVTCLGHTHLVFANMFLKGYPLEAKTAPKN